MKNLTCEQCKFYSGGVSSGTCRRYPPKIYKNRTLWPDVDNSTKICGEFVGIDFLTDRLYHSLPDNITYLEINKVQEYWEVEIQVDNIEEVFTGQSITLEEAVLEARKSLIIYEYKIVGTIE